jgi:beta-glucosidase
MSPFLKFPKNFLWGAATSSYQIEGGWDADGKGPSIWDTFTRVPGTIEDGSSGDIACDHYYRWQEDIDVMRYLGLRAYRFSVSWPRVLPQGRGKPNQAGLDFYGRLVDGLLEAGITPFLTLYHWDLPQALQDEGGWTSRTTAEAFAEYADLMSSRLGDRVKHWSTHNEPPVIAWLGHQMGIFAPGVKDTDAALHAAHHILLSHGLAVPVIRANIADAEVGIVVDVHHHEPASESEHDRTAAKLNFNRYSGWFLEPLYGRPYPQDVLDFYTREGMISPAAMEVVLPGDMETIAVPTDFLGLNYYSRTIARSTEVPEEENAPQIVVPAPSEERTEMDWEVVPDGLYQVLKMLQREYAPAKIYITENGASYSDGPAADGAVHDRRRTEYLRMHFAAANRALGEGVPLAGYFVWSLMDNFEWSRGYKQRFGIVWVDYETQQRIPKDSALWYRQVIENNGLEAGS